MYPSPLLQAQGERIEAMLSLETMGYYSDEPGTQKYPFPFSWFYPDSGNFVGFEVQGVSEVQGVRVLEAPFVTRPGSGSGDRQPVPVLSPAV